MSRIILIWIALALVLAGLVLWNGRLEERERSARDTAHRIGRMIPADERERMQVAALSVGSSGHEPWVYAPRDGVWRCANYFGAICSEEAVDGLQKALLEAEGVVRSSDPERAADYGLGLETSCFVRFHGAAVLEQADRDVLFEVELGRQHDTLDGCYVRRADHSAVWSIDTNPWQSLAPSAAGLPPLLDPHVIPRIWPGKSRRVDRVTVEHAAGPRLELTLEEIQITEEEMRQGKSPFIWGFTVDGEAAEVDPQAAMSFTSFLFRTPYQRIIDPRLGREFGFAEPRAKVTLHPAEGDPAEIRIGKETAEGVVPVANMNTKSIFEVAAQIADLLAPGPDLLRAGASGNPWEIWLRR